MPPTCPTELHTYPDGRIVLKSTGKTFEDMNAFQEWWNTSEFKNNCPLPVLSGKGGRNTDTHDIPPENEKTYATTPINKVDDYEFTRIFGNENKDDYNTILFDRTQDWVNKPYSSEERQQIAGRVPSIETFTGDASPQVMDIVLKAYSSEPDYEPVVTQVGVNQWEVNELKPKRSESDYVDTSIPIMDTPHKQNNSNNSNIDVSFKSLTADADIDPYFSGLSGSATDPFYGSVPGMERMFGPTFDTTNWA